MRWIVSSQSISNWLPALQWLPTYRVENLRLDVVAGLSLAAFAIPESIAYASRAEVPPVSGLYCYLVAGVAYALFGTSRQLAVGPTSALAIVVAASIAAMGGGDAGRVIALASALALLVGLISIAGRPLGFGNLAYFISDTVLIGFKTGAAFYIASTQLPKLLGIHGVQGNFFERIGHVIMSLPDTHLPSLALGVAAIALFLAFERLLPGRPTTLIVVVAAIAATAIFKLGQSGVAVVGELPAGLPQLTLPKIHASDISELVPTAFACFFLAYAEAISTARSFAQKHGYDIDPDQELTALGACNVAAGMAQGFPVAGGMSQTAINDMGGASTPASLIVTSIAVGLTLLFFAPFFHNLPEPVLGAIVLMAAKHLVRFEDLRRLRTVSRQEFRISFLAFVAVLALGLLNGILLAAAGSLVILIARASKPQVVVLERDAASGRFINRARHKVLGGIPGVLVLRCAGAWLYFNADHIRRHILKLADEERGPLTRIVLDFSMVPSVDVTAGNALRNLARALKQRGIAVEIAELRDDVFENLSAINAQLDLDHLATHKTIEDCISK